MGIRNLHETDFVELVALFKSFYPKHNIFQGFSDEVIEYLRTLARVHKFLVFEEEDFVKGVVIMQKRSETREGRHKLWRLKHIAFETEEIGAALVKEAEKRIEADSQTVKLEIFVAESETVLGFLKGLGYKQEAALENHYRWHETCFVLSKSLPKVY